jgi:SOS response regulatory protein OraA/RecX
MEVMEMVEQDEKDKTLEYVVDRLILANLKYNQILELTCTLRDSLGKCSEKEIKEKVKNYLLSRGYSSTAD